MPRWQLMVALVFGLYAGSKGVTWWLMRHDFPRWKVAAWLLAWPGMNLREFADPHGGLDADRAQWLAALVWVLSGCVLLWGVCPNLDDEIARGWAGMLGIFFIVHTGIFGLLSLGWRASGMGAQPLFRAPLRSCSLGVLWSRRWNRAFHQLVAELVYRPSRTRLGRGPSTMLGFLVSGGVHDLAISVPAGGGYGLPTAYFLLQALGVQFERSRPGTALGLGRGVRGWIFTVVIAAGPAYWLFHPVFVTAVVLPMLDALGAGRP